MVSERSAALLLAALASCVLPHRAAAHAPIVRSAALSDAGTGHVIDLPGFGLLIGDARGDAYACDALLGVSPSEQLRPVLFEADGSILVGTSAGLRTLDSAGCPRTERALDGLTIVALAAARSGRRYALTSGDTPSVFARDVPGGTWTRTSLLPLASTPTGLVVDERDAERVLVSFDVSAELTTLRILDAAGASSRDVSMPRGFQVLHASNADDATLWAVQRSADAVVNTGFVIVRAGSIDGPWESVRELDYYGGFTREDDGTLWLADGAEGVFRSTDDGATFESVTRELRPACIVAAQGSVWACQANLPNVPAVLRLDRATDTFLPAITLSNVGDLVTCPAQTDVASICALAHFEWRRDVQGIPSSGDAGTDAGGPAAGPEDAGESAPRDAGEAARDAESTPDASLSPDKNDGGCSVHAGAAHAPYTLLALAALMLRRRRRR